MIERKPWTKKHTLAIALAAFSILVLFIIVGPGADYFGCYTWMVMEPERYAQIPERPWTLNPPWMVPFMAPFVTFPGRVGYALFLAATIGMILYTTYHMGGKPVPILLSAHMSWILWWGQIEGWGVLAIALGWLALEKKSWKFSFLALVLASFKPQISLVPVIALWWWLGRERWKPLVGMAVLLTLSLLAWGPWLVWYWQGLFNFTGENHYQIWNSSLGLIALPLFLPALLVPFTRDKRVIALTATALLVIPYMPYYTTISLMVFNIPWWAYIFGFTSYLASVIGTQLAWNGVALMSLSVLAWLYFPFIKSWFNRIKTTRIQTES